MTARSRRADPPRRPGPEDGKSGSGRRRWRKFAPVAGILLVVAVVDVVILTRGGGSGEESVDRPDLRAEGVMGCYVLRAGPWSLRFPAPAGGEATGEETGAGTAAGRASPPGPTGPGAPPTLPAALEPPARVSLLPDSADLHGRDLPSFRAEAIPPGERPGRVLRWTVRADTLWLVWSEPGARAGMALFAEGDSLVGSARGVVDSVDGSAPAAAWPINCSTLARERRGDVPRR